MLRNLDDVLGKNILHDIVQLRGLAQTEAEVPPGNAKRIDLWFVPEQEKLRVSPEFTGILVEITAEPAAIEVWSAPPAEDDFRVSMTKRDLWRETLALRDKRSWPCPTLWHICAGKPETVLAEFGYEPAEIPGWYRPHKRGLRVQIVVIGELPKARSTLLLRLLGRGKVRRDALRELRALPDDAWEKLLARPWLVRLRLEVPVDQRVSPEDREFFMDIQAWYRNFIETHDREVEARVLRGLDAQRAEERRQAELKPIAHLFEHRLRRRLTTDERMLLAARVDTLGSTHVADLVLDLSTDELASWLESGETRQDG